MTDKIVYVDEIHTKVCEKGKKYTFDLFRVFVVTGFTLLLIGVVFGFLTNILYSAATTLFLTAAVLVIGIFIGINSIDYEIQRRGKDLP